ncbi:MAG: glycosyltransferase family A protein [Opitutaceae bacterium]|jgi:glycosyltransferase involved in cell wall biosynthesis|nr:glycosyltransferase family A protein [Opitutaceae bacterium]
MLRSLLKGKASNPEESLRESEVCIIMPMFNSEKYLEDSIRSILDQDISDWNLILIDDGSIDQTVKIAESFAEKHENITLITGHQQKGPSKLRNIGIQKCRSEFIAFLDSDDMMSPNSLSSRIAAIKSDPLAIGSYSPVSLIDPNGLKLDLNGTKKEIVNFCDLAGNLFITSCILVRANQIKKLGGFDTNLLYGEDWDLWLRLTRLGYYIKCAPQSHIQYRQHPQSHSHSNLHRDFKAREAVSKIAWMRDKRCPDVPLYFREGMGPASRAMANTQRAFTTYISCIFIGNEDEGLKILNDVNPLLLSLSDPQTLASASRFAILRNAVAPASEWSELLKNKREFVEERSRLHCSDSLKPFLDKYLSKLFS